MLLVASLLLTALGILAAARWAATRRDALGRVRAFPVLGVVVPLVAGLALMVPVAQRHRTEARLSAVASVLVGHRVDVDCASTGAGLLHVGSDVGRVAVGADGRPATTTVLADEICDDLERWRKARHDEPDRPDEAGAVAVHVLTHESMHLAGVLDEAAAECAAVQRDVRTARLLGASPAVAARTSRTYWLVTYQTLPDAYRTPECAAGQRLDEGLPDAPWQSADPVPPSG